MIPPLGQPSRDEVEAAITEALSHLGLDGQVDKLSIAREFMGRGLSKATVYRWIKDILASGRPGMAIEAKVIEATRARAQRTAEPARDAAEAIVTMIPPMATLGDMTGTTGTIAVIERIIAILADMDLLVKHAKTDDGKVRNSKLLLAASHEMRGTLETAMKLKAAMRQDRDLDALMANLVAEVARESPECAERILRRMRGVLTLHGS